MNTPNTKQLRERHVPTPKMSARKKDLFGTNSRSSLINLVIDEDSDLGPIIPLEYSSSPKSYDRPIENHFTKHLTDQRTDFSNLMEQLSPAIKNSCRISQESPKRLTKLAKYTNETTEDVMMDDIVLEKENVEELLKTPALGAVPRTVPRISFRKTHNMSDCSDGTVSPKSRKSVARRNGENKKNDASDTPKAKASLTFGEISAKSFYGTANVEPATKRSPVERVPIAIKASKRRVTSAPNRRHHERRPGARKPILGSIRKLNSKFKATKVKKVSPLTKHIQLLDKIDKVIDTSRLKNYFKDLQTSDFDKQLIGGNSSKVLKESVKSLNKSTGTLEHDGKRFLSEEDEVQNEVNEQEEQENVQNRKFFKSKSTRTQNRYQVAKGISATVKRGHGIKLLSPPKKRQKIDDGYDELLSIQKEVLDIVKRLSSNNAAEVAGTNDESKKTPRNVETDELYLSETEMQCDNTMYDKYRKMIPYNTTDANEIKRQETVLEILIENGICNDQNFKIFISAYEQNKDEAELILNNLFDISVSPDINEQEQMWTSDDRVTIPNHSTTSISHTSDSVGQEISGKNKEKREFHPIFYKDHRRSDAKKDLLSVPLPKTFKWIPISDKQLQIDAGQSEFGSRNCSECGMFYTLHDPEDEILHQKFHNNMMGVLVFKGWTQENLVANIEEWGDKGRIIWVNTVDIKQKVTRVLEIIDIINNDLGFANVELQQTSIVYLAISRKLIIGVCVAEPLKQAHTMYTEDNLEYIDLKNAIPVKCGISRIWVTPQFRRYGVATRLIQSVCSHFVRGYDLSASEIAFSTPTVMGRQFAQSITPNILVYDQV